MFGEEAATVPNYSRSPGRNDSLEIDPRPQADCGDIYWVPNEASGFGQPGPDQYHPGLVGPRWLQPYPMVQLYPGTSKMNQSHRGHLFVPAGTINRASRNSCPDRASLFLLSLPYSLSVSVIAGLSMMGRLPPEFIARLKQLLVARA